MASGWSIGKMRLFGVPLALDYMKSWEADWIRWLVSPPKIASASGLPYNAGGHHDGACPNRQRADKEPDFNVESAWPMMETVALMAYFAEAGSLCNPQLQKSREARGRHKI